MGGTIFSNPDLVISYAVGSGLTALQDQTLNKLNTLTEDVSGLRFTAKALEEAPSGGGGGGSAPTAEENALAVRAELSTELSRIDVATSTRLSTAGYTAPANSEIAAIKIKTDNLPSDPADNSQILDAISNIPEAPTAQEVREEIDDNSVKLDVAVSTRLASADYVEPDDTDVLNAIAAIQSSPSASTIRTEIESSTILAKESSISALGSPLQAGSYVAPANADIAAIKAKTDILVNTDLTGIATSAEISDLDSKLDEIKNNTDLIPATV